MVIPILQVGMPWFDPLALIVRNDVKLHIILFLPQPGYYDRAFVLYG